MQAIHLEGRDGDRAEALHTAEDLEGWSARAGGGAAYALVLGDRSFAIPHLSGPADPTEVLECAVDVPLPRADGLPYPSTLKQEYMQGGCDVFACALEDLLDDGYLYAVHEPDEEDPTRQHMLIHVGLLIDGERVLDVEGFHDVDEWAERWGSRAETEEWEYGEVSRSEMEVMQGARPGERLTEAAIAEAMPHAAFVAALAGADIPAPAPRP